jgi:hypothetical protein
MNWGPKQFGALGVGQQLGRASVEFNRGREAMGVVNVA